MRLLHIGGHPWSSEPLQITLTEHNESDVPPYIILSHRWRDEEVLFADMMDPDRSVAQKKKGYTKIEWACRLGSRMGFKHAWVDTCCINKDSSDDLSEAINSMFQYYENSRDCFVYLDDVPDSNALCGFGASTWFTRGWTLQELIAPSTVTFFSKGWKMVGVKEKLIDQLVPAAGVPKPVLEDRSNLYNMCAAEKLSWASMRVTTQEEDESYSLLGLFGVNMTPLYGEGRARAFRRLQVEILKKSPDHSLFAWSQRTAPAGMLASSVRSFMSEHTYQQFDSRDYIHTFGLDSTKCELTHAGLHIQLPVAPVPGKSELYYAFLGCRPVEHEKTVGIVATCLHKYTNGQSHTYCRVSVNDCTVFHIKDWNRFGVRVEELLISSTPKLMYEPGPHEKLTMQTMNFSICFPRNWALVSYPLVLEEANDHSTSQGQVKLRGSLQRQTPRVDVILLHDGFTEGSKRCVYALAFGEVNHTRWTYATIMPRLSHNSKNWKREISDMSARLQKDCEFPHGSAWRNHQRSFYFHSANPAIMGSDYTGQTLTGPWRMDYDYGDPAAISWSSTIFRRRPVQCLHFDINVVPPPPALQLTPPTLQPPPIQPSPVQSPPAQESSAQSPPAPSPPVPSRPVPSHLPQLLPASSRPTLPSLSALPQPPLLLGPSPSRPALPSFQGPSLLRRPLLGPSVPRPSRPGPLRPERVLPMPSRLAQLLSPAQQQPFMQQTLQGQVSRSRRGTRSGQPARQNERPNPIRRITPSWRKRTD